LSQTAFRREALPEDPPQRKPRKDRDTEHRSEQRRRRIGLANICDDLARIDQVVYRDEVEARSELLPEVPLRGGCEEQHEARQDPQAVEYEAMGPAAPDPVRHDQ